MAQLKFIISVGLLSMAMPILYAQYNIGIDSYYLGNYEKAEDFFKSHIADNPEIYNCYLGEIAYAKGDTGKAGFYYSEGLRANPESTFNIIGQAKLTFKASPENAESALNDIAKKNKKDVPVILAIGRAYLSNNMVQQAMRCVNDAKKIDGKAPDIYILEGDIIASGDSNEKVGNAAGKYEMAIYFSPDYALGYMKVAQVYEHANPTMAIDKLKTIIEKQPDYLPAYSFLGKLYTQNGFYPEAISVFQTCFKYGAYTLEDIERYARSFYFTNNFAEAGRLVDEGLSINPDHFVLNRYKMYITEKTGKTDEEMIIANKFFALRDTVGYIANDYSVYASILGKNKNYEEAHIQYDKSIRLEPRNTVLYAEAAAMARENKNYALAASYVKKQMDEKAGKSAQTDSSEDVVDLNTLGYDYYSAGVSITKNDSLAKTRMKKKEIVNELLTSNLSVITDSMSNVGYFSKIYALYYLNKADSVFDILINRLPDSYSGYRYKALTQHAIYPVIEEGKAKPYYEKVVGIITKDEGGNSASVEGVLLEAYNYLGYYYYMKNDKKQTVAIWQKVLELDPGNKNAKLVLDDMEKKGSPNS